MLALGAARFASHFFFPFNIMIWGKRLLHIHQCSRYAAGIFLSQEFLQLSAQMKWVLGYALNDFAKGYNGEPDEKSSQQIVARLYLLSFFVI